MEVEAVYAVSQAGQDERLTACNLDNHKLLWHGTRVSNLISILSRGLLVAPPEAPTTGMRYGRVCASPYYLNPQTINTFDYTKYSVFFFQGIYFSNSFNFSCNYCFSDVGRTKYMLLCEVCLHDTLYYIYCFLLYICKWFRLLDISCRYLISVSI